MRWLKRDMWKAGITITCMLLLLALMVWLPVSAASVDEKASGLATPVTATVQATPTIDATVTELNKEKLLHDVDQQQHILGNWLWNNGAAVISSLVLVIAGAFTLLRYLRDQRNEREKQREDRQTELEKRAEERFQAAVTGLGDEKESAKIGAAILLRTFLHPGYEQFYTQTFDLAVANLRFLRTSHPSEDPDGIPHSPEDSNTPLPLTTLSQALIVVFKEAFPLARNIIIGDRKDALQSLDATHIQLDNAYLSEADLKQVWMPQASLREAILFRADLSVAKLSGADLSGADLSGADLSEAYLVRAVLSGAKLIVANLSNADLSSVDLSNADLSSVDLSNADLSGADLRRAKLSEADLSGADLRWTKLSGAVLWRATLTRTDLSNADLSGADLSEADLSGAVLSGANLRGANLSNSWRAPIENALSLEDTNLRGVTGLTKEQLIAYKAKGAIIDEDTTTSSSQSAVSPSPPSPSNDVQAPDAGDSNATSPKPGPES